MRRCGRRRVPIVERSNERLRALLTEDREPFDCEVDRPIRFAKPLLDYTARPRTGLSHLPEPHRSYDASGASGSIGTRDLQVSVADVSIPGLY